MSVTQIAYRTQKTIGITECYPEYDALSGFSRPTGTIRCFTYSPDGQYFSFASPEKVTIVNPDTGAIVQELEIPNVHAIGFSPKGSFFITWERPSKLEDGSAAKNLKVWNTRTAEQVVSFVQKSQTGWNLQYTYDEKYCARVVTNTVQFFESSNMNQVWQNLRVEGVSDFQLSPGENSHIAVFIPEKKGMPAKVQIFAVPKFDAPISQKSFFKADKIQFKWNAAGTALVFVTQTEVDKTGKSYYGETTLYLMNIKTGSDSRVHLEKEGPVHDVTWSPNSKEFGVVYGYMPAKTTIFDTQANAVHSCPLGPRNTVLFSPHGKFILVAGFGNLTGQMDIYDREKGMTKLCTIEASNATLCEWSPDGRYIMTATTSPRLRVDNGVKIWYAIGGQLMYNEEMTELYEVTWRPQAVSNYPVPTGTPEAPKPHPSAANHAAATPVKPAGAYRPPGARGSATPLHFKREDEGGTAHVAGSSGLFNGTSESTNGGGGGGLFGARRRREVPGAAPADEKGAPGAAPGGGVSLSGGAGAEGEQALSKTALKNKKKREAAKKAREAAQASGQEGSGSGTTGPERGNGESGGRVQNLRTNDNRGHRRENSRHRDRSQSRPNNGDRRHHNREGSWNHHQRNHSPHPGQPGGPQRQRSQRHKKDNNHQNNNNNQAGQQQPQQGQQPQQSSSRPPAQTIQTNNTLAPNDTGLQTPVTPGGGTPEEKKQRSLLKKLRAIDDLKMRHANGEKLEDTQMKKISSEDSVRKELEGLGWKG